MRHLPMTIDNLNPRKLLSALIGCLDRLVKCPATRPVLRIAMSTFGFAICLVSINRGNVRMFIVGMMQILTAYALI